MSTTDNGATAITSGGIAKAAAEAAGSTLGAPRTTAAQDATARRSRDKPATGARRIRVA